MLADQKGGTFTLTARKGKSLDYREVADFLSERQKTQWVEITVVGEVTREQDQLALEASRTGERFLLGPEPSKQTEPRKKGSPFQKLEAAVKAGKKITAVTGKVQEPKAEKGKRKPPVTLLVTSFETAEE